MLRATLNKWLGRPASAPQMLVFSNSDTVAIMKRLDLLELTILTNQENTDMANQDRINELTDRLGVAADGIRGDIADLKAQVAAGTPAEELDFTSLEARAAQFEGLDAETSQAPVVDEPAPVDPGTPVDEVPVDPNA